MNDKITKNVIIAITYAIALILMVINFNKILLGIGAFLGLLNPLFIGIGIAFVLNRPYEFVVRIIEERLKIKEGKAKMLGVLITYLLVLAFFIGIIRIIVPQLVENIKTFASNIELYLFNLQKILNDITEILGVETLDLSEIGRQIANYIGKLGTAMAEMLTQIIGITTNIVSVIVDGLVAIVLSIYILSGKDNLIRQGKRILFVYLPSKLYNKMSYIMNTIVEVFNNYISGQIIEAFILGCLCFIGMLILRIDYAGLISILIAITALIPILGAYLGGGISFLLLLLINPKKAIIFIIFLVILQQIETNLIYPRVVGKKVGLPGMWVLLGVSIGGGMFGFIGMLMGVPVTTVCYVLLRNDVNSKYFLR